jgi:hypothetical protein
MFVSGEITEIPGDASKQLRSGKPSIVLAKTAAGLSMNSFMLQPGEEKVLAEHLIQLFRVHSA